MLTRKSSWTCLVLVLVSFSSFGFLQKCNAKPDHGLDVLILKCNHNIQACHMKDLDNDNVEYTADQVNANENRFSAGFWIPTEDVFEILEKLDGYWFYIEKNCR